MPIIDAWRAIASQWRAVGLADGRVHWLGLDYAGAQVGLQLAELVVTPAIWAGVRVMESAAKAVLNGAA